MILVRHAEKDLATGSEDPILNKTGEERASLLAEMLRDAGVTTIFVTQYKRTALTVGPIAKKLGTVPKKRSARDSAGLVSDIRRDHRDDVVLVSGHSNTIPELLKLLGYRKFVEIAESEYDNLFFVIPRGEASEPVVVRLRFGAGQP